MYHSLPFVKSFLIEIQSSFDSRCLLDSLDLGIAIMF